MSGPESGPRPEEIAAQAEASAERAEEPKEARLDADHEAAVEGAIELTKRKELRDVVNATAEFIDDTAAMEAVRAVWDKVPAPVQRVMMAGPGVGEAAEALVRMGLLDYKNAPTEQDVADMGKKKAEHLEMAVKYGKYLAPELAALEPAIEPIKAIEKAKDDVFAGTRDHLREARRKRENEEKIEEAKQDLDELYDAA
jgi:hypothetical protein